MSNTQQFIGGRCYERRTSPAIDTCRKGLRLEDTVSLSGCSKNGLRWHFLLVAVLRRRPFLTIFSQEAVPGISHRTFFTADVTVHLCSQQAIKGLLAIIHYIVFFNSSRLWPPLLSYRTIDILIVFFNTIYFRLDLTGTCTLTDPGMMEGGPLYFHFKLLFLHA